MNQSFRSSILACVEEEMKKCSFCGTENSDRAILCELCGRRFKPENEEQIDEPLIINEEKLKDAINRTGETNMVKD